MTCYSHLIRPWRFCRHFNRTSSFELIDTVVDFPDDNFLVFKHRLLRQKCCRRLGTMKNKSVIDRCDVFANKDAEKKSSTVQQFDSNNQFGSDSNRGIKIFRLNEYFCIQRNLLCSMHLLGPTCSTVADYCSKRCLLYF